jgi:hypothetical protein
LPGSDFWDILWSRALQEATYIYLK